jgi:hypothetical protein
MTLTKHDIIGLAKELRKNLEIMRREVGRLRVDGQSAEYGFGVAYYAVLQICKKSPNWTKEVRTRFHHIVEREMYFNGGEEE